MMENLSADDLIDPAKKALMNTIFRSQEVNHHLVEEISDSSLKEQLRLILIKGDEITSSKGSTQWKECAETLKGYQKSKRIDEIKEQLTNNEQLSDTDQNKLLEELAVLVKV